MRKSLIFYKRKNKEDKLTKEKAESRLGRITHFETVGWVKSKKNLDIRGIQLYLWESARNLTFKIPAPIFGKLVMVYYIEQ